MRAALAVAYQHFVDEGIMHIARQHHVVPRCAGVSEDIQDHLCGAAMGHPVLGIDQQWIPQPAERPLHRLDQLDAKDGGRRDDDGRRVVEQGLLQLAQGFPVEQAGWFLEVAFTAPAAGAGVEHQQWRVARQHELPALEAQHIVNQGILQRSIQGSVGQCALAQCLALGDQFAAGVGVVAPALAQQVGQQRIADDAFGEGMTVGGLLPLRRQVPVVSDVMSITVGSLRSMDSNWKLENAAFPSKSQLVHMD